MDILYSVALLDDSHLNDVTSGFTPLHIACKHNNFEAVKFLCQHPAINGLIENWCGQTALHIASRVPNFEMIKFLYNKFHYDLNISDLNCWTPLHYATKKGSYKIVNFLIENGADPSITTNDNNTNSWIIAIKRESPNITKLLSSY